MSVMNTGNPPPSCGFAARRSEGRERMIARAGKRNLPQEAARAERAFHAMRSFEEWPAADDSPDQQLFARQIHVELHLFSHFQQEVFASIRPGQHLEAFRPRAFHRRKEQLLPDGRIDHGRPEPPELLLAPGAHVLRFAATELVGQSLIEPKTGWPVGLLSWYYSC